ncbi:hypothetical protein ACSG7X_003503 [Vibrio fluvialis]
MIILSKNLNIEEIKSNIHGNHEKISAINNLLLANYNRKHIVIFKRHDLDFIIANNDIFGYPARVHAQDILYTLTQVGGMVYSIPIRIEVDFAELTNEDSAIIDNKEIISLYYKRFSDPEFISSPILLGEHLNDAKLYYHFSTLFLATSTNYRGLKLNIKPDHGGGSTTINKFKLLKEQYKICFCILDSDRKYPEDTEKDTSKSFSKYERKIGKLAKAIVIDAHEIESIIPIKILEDMLIDKRYGDESINKLDSIKIIDKYRRYLDHKEGIDLKTAIEYKNKNTTEHWYNIFGMFPEVKKMDCYVNSSCSNCQKCPLIGGFGDKLLANTVDYIDNKTGIHKYRNNIDSKLLDEWSFFAKNIIHWGCALSHPTTVT